MTRGVFITGTDTGVGKTAVAAGFVLVLRAAGIDAVPMKPVQTGCIRRRGRWVAPDLELALRIAGLAVTEREKHWMAPYRFRPAVSPHLAARLAGRSIAISAVVASFRQLAQRHEFIVVEGAGGVLAPLSLRRTMVDLMRALALPVVLVARPGLGTLNHTLLSLRELRRAGLQVRGIVLNAAQRSRPGLIERDNRATIEAMSGVPVIAALPHSGALERAVRRLDAVRYALRAALSDNGNIAFKCACLNP